LTGIASAADFHALPAFERAGRFCNVLLLVAGLVLLQNSFFGSGPIYELPALALIAAGALVGLITGWRSRESALQPVCFGAATLLVGYVAVRAIGSPEPYYARADLWLAATGYCAYTAVAAVLPHPRQRMLCVGVLLIVAICHVFVGVIQFGIGGNLVVFDWLQPFAPQSAAAQARATGFYANPDHLAGLLEVLGMFALSLACWSRWRRSWRVAVGYVALFCYVGLALTGSRGGYLSAALGLLVFGFLSLIALRAGGASLFWGWTLVGAIVVAAAVYIGGNLIQQSATLAKRIEEIVAVDQARVDLWRAALEQWRLQPWFGTGGRTYQFYARRFRAETLRGDPSVAHNDYVQFLAEYGVIGMAIFLLFLGTHLHRGWRAFVAFGPRRIAAGAPVLSDRLALTIGSVAAMSSYMLHSVVDFNMHIAANALLLALVAALLGQPPLVPTSQPFNQPMARLARSLGIVVAAVLLIQYARLIPAAYYAAKAEAALDAENPDSAAAINAAEAGLARDPRNPRLYQYLSGGYRVRGEEARDAQSRTESLERALEALHEARKLSPLDSNLLVTIARVYDDLGKYREAEWIFYLALEADPKSVELRKLYRIHLWRWRNGR
jgi:O-antigen ligase